MNEIMPLLLQLVRLRDHAPAELALDGDLAQAQAAARFYAAVHAALPALIARLAEAQSALSEAPAEPSIEAFRRVRAVLRAAQAWHARTPEREADLVPVLDAAVAAWASAAGASDPSPFTV